MANPTLLATFTGERFQPVRLHYKVLNRPGLKRAFESLRCVKYDAPRQRWVWLYEHEARTLRFEKSYDEFPKELRPIVIGAFLLRTGDTLLLDLRSCERALLALPFFDKHLPRKLAVPESAEIVNQLFHWTKENQQLTPDALFDGQVSTGSDSETLVQETIAKAAAGRIVDDELRILVQELEARSKAPLPRIERLSIHFAEDGIGGFQLALRLRQIVAMEHWLGNSRFTLDDALKATTRNL